MEKRRKALKVMAETAGLTPVHFDERNSRVYLTCEAPNGTTKEFWLSEATRPDPRAEQHELSAMRRFARDNQTTTQQPATPAKPEPKRRGRPPMKQQTIASTAIAAALQQAGVAPSSASAAPSVTVRPVEVIELGPREFFNLAEWVRSQNLTMYASFSVLQLEAAKHLGQPVDEASLRSAMEMTGAKEPPHWGEPTDPQAIIVRELARVMSELGVIPTPAFNKLHAKLLP